VAVVARGIVDGIAAIEQPVTTAVAQDFHPVYLTISYYCYSNTFGVTLKIPLVETTL
jgi:hypothetical protein